MWEGVDNPNQTDDMTWLVDSMKNNTITWCTDGSYHMKLATKVIGAEWNAYCTKTENRMTGNFLKIPEDSSSYRIKLLGLCIIQHLIAALFVFYNIKTGTSQLSVLTKVL